MGKSELRKILSKIRYIIKDRNSKISHEEDMVKKLNDRLAELNIEKAKLQKDIDSIKSEINMRIERIIDLKFYNEESEKKLIDIKNKL